MGGCRACETCFKTGKACSFDNDFNTIAPAILEADAVVFSMPVYWYSIPAQIKGVIDRLFSFVVGEVLVPGVLNVGDIAKTDGCKQAAALAETF